MTEIETPKEIRELNMRLGLAREEVRQCIAERTDAIRRLLDWLRESDPEIVDAWVAENFALRLED